MMRRSITLADRALAAIERETGITCEDMKLEDDRSLGGIVAAAVYLMRYAGGMNPRQIGERIDRTPHSVSGMLRKERTLTKPGVRRLIDLAMQDPEIRANAMRNGHDDQRHPFKLSTEAA